MRQSRPSHSGLLGVAVCAVFVTAQACEADAAPIPRANRPRATKPATLAMPAGLSAVDAGTLSRMASQPQSRGLVVNVWASWCGSCRQEVPMLLKLRESLADSGLRLEFVSADEPPDLPKVAQLLKTWEIASPGLVVAPGTLGQFKQALSPDWRGGIPATFLLDAQGTLRHLWEGPILEEEIAPVLQRYLSGDAVDGVTRTAAERD